MEKKVSEHVEIHSTTTSDFVEDLQTTSNEAHVVGTVQLLVNNETVLIPTPSPDPKDPLNLPAWRKWAITLTLGAYAATAVVLASGMGAIFTDVAASYPGQTARATDLLTYPTLFMGIGNLISMPLALVVGRRPVFIFSMVLLVVSGIWCAKSTSLSSHIAGRDFMSLAAGQSEALCPMMIQEIHFLHERGRKLSWFAATQGIGTAIFFLASTYLVPAWGWRWWYGVFSIFNGVVLVVSVLLVCETAFTRPADATEGAVHLEFNQNGEVEEGGQIHKVVRVTTRHGQEVNKAKYSPRTWRDDLRIFHFNPQWSQALSFYQHIARGVWIPSLFWLILLNGTYLGQYVFQASTFAPVLLAPPYSFKFQNLGFVQAAQVFDCMIFLPLLGYGSDIVIKLMSRWHKGVYEPEYRLLVLIIPAIVVVITSILYGQAGTYPENWSWGTVAVSYNCSFFAFLGANIVGLTYAIDSFPLRAGPVLVLICAGRGFLSFGLSYTTIPLVATRGYDGSSNIFAIVNGVLSLLAVLVYIFGRKIRTWGEKWFDATKVADVKTN